MPTGTSLTTLLTMLKAEIGNESTVSTAQDTALYQLLNNTQVRLASEYDWPFLKVRADVTVSSRYTNLPSTLNWDRPTEVTTQSGGVWCQVVYGIDDNDLTVFDPSTTTSGPVQRWQFYTGAQFEVWPIPGTSATVRFNGQSKITAMATGSPGVASTLDDLLIVYTTAADILRRLKSNDADAMQAKAQERITLLRRSLPVRYEHTTLTGRPRDVQEKRIIIAVSGS